MRSCSSQRHEVNIGTPEEESHGKINGTSCQNSLVFMSECTSAQALAVVHNTTGRGVLRQPLTFCITPSSFEDLPAKQWWHPGILFDSIWRAQRRPKPASTMPSLKSFTCTVSGSVPEHEPCMFSHHLVQVPVKGS